jgi:hypothetical protein
LLSAWATAGILGPVIVNYMREYQLGLGLPRGQIYNQTMMILAGMLVLGLVCNLLIRPVADKWFMAADELGDEQAVAHNEAAAIVSEPKIAMNKPFSVLMVLMAWALVAVPLGWGIYKTLMNASKFFS